MKLSETSSIITTIASNGLEEGVKVRVKVGKERVEIDRELFLTRYQRWKEGWRPEPMQR